MDIFSKKVSEVTFWHLLAAVGAVVALVLVVHTLVKTDNMVTTGANGSFIKPSYFGPLSADKKAEIATNYDKKVAEAAAAKK
jgi:hypothetical protein